MKGTPRVKGFPRLRGECFTQIFRLLNCVPRGQFETAPEGIQQRQTHRFSITLLRNLPFKKMAHKYPILFGQGTVLVPTELKGNFQMKFAMDRAQDQT